MKNGILAPTKHSSHVYITMICQYIIITVMIYNTTPLDQEKAGDNAFWYVVQRLAPHWLQTIQLAE